MGDTVRNRHLGWEGTVVSAKNGKIEVFGTSCSALYNSKDFDVVHRPKPTFTGTYVERQAQWVKHHGLKVGSKVKVVREFKRGEGGFNSSYWDSYKKRDLGNTLKIVKIEKGYFEVGMSFYPYFALEPIA